MQFAVRALKLVECTQQFCHSERKEDSLDDHGMVINRCVSSCVHYDPAL